MKKIRVLTLEDNESKPLIVTFPQNHPSKRFLVADENGGDDYEEDLIEFDLYQHQHSKSKNIIYGHNSKFDWLGSNAGRTYKKVQGSKYVLGFYSDKSKHLTVVETQDVFNLKQYIKDEKVAEEEERLAPNIRAIEQKKLLVEEFGNTRSRKMMDALKTSIVTENKISGASEIKEILMEKAEEFKKDMDEKKDDTFSVFIQSKRETLPEFDLQAEIPEKVYNLFSIIPREEWENLNTKEFHAAIKADNNNMLDRIKSHCSKFALQELADIKRDLGTTTDKDKGEKDTKSEKKRFKGKATLNSKIKCLVYLNWLLKFLEMRVVHKTVEQLCEDMKMHQSNVKSILNRFFIASNKEQDKVVYIRNTMLTDKLISYILILALIYGDFEFDATVLIATMKLEHKKFIKHCDEIGCTQKKKKQGEEEKTIMKLEAPIKFKPPPTKKPKKN